MHKGELFSPFIIKQYETVAIAAPEIVTNLAAITVLYNSL